MKATIYYIRLSDEQRRELNGAGWSGPVGRTYLRAKDGVLDEETKALYEKAATGDFSNAEEAWVGLQSVAGPWTEKAVAECHTDFPRSMDVGDIVVWEDGRKQCCCSTGFKDIDPDIAFP